MSVITSLSPFLSKSDTSAKELIYFKRGDEVGGAVLAGEVTREISKFINCS
jgi:hypothetical protein